MNRFALLLLLPACLTELEIDETAVDESEIESVSPTETVPTDSTPPVTYFHAAPQQWTKSQSAQFEYHASEPSTFHCKLDGAAYAPCAQTGVSYYLPPGAHTFCVYATDRSGNVDATPLCYTWTIDQTPPQTTITSAPTAYTESRSATFRYTSSEAGWFRCTLDGVPASCSGSSATFSNLALGNHTFIVQAWDRAGNYDTSPAVYNWRITVF